MPNIKTGQEVPCFACGKLVYKTRAYLLRGHKRVSCGAPECKTKSMQGENNPFWGKIHDEATRQRIRETRRATPYKTKPGPPKGYKHTPEARAKITIALRERWINNRDVMLKSLEHLRLVKPREDQRYRRNFTPLQRREFKDPNCYWCQSTEDLILDHIIPVSCGGVNERRNAQTLCRTCNLWKMAYVDRPLFLAGLGSKEGASPP
jgi:5-methylcytosine-specific restriction endonuclease McrA